MTETCRNCGKPGGQATQHDWDAVCLHCGQLLWLRPGDVAECKVARLTAFGIFVELGDGVEGLIHITELTGQSIRHPDEVVAVGSLIRAQVLRVDVSARRIGLSRRQLVP
jgi:small subunit ribosomal protein S1